MVNKADFADILNKTCSAENLILTQMHLTRAFDLDDQDEFEDALSEFAAAIRLVPDHAEAITWVWFCCNQLSGTRKLSNPAEKLSAWTRLLKKQRTIWLLRPLTRIWGLLHRAWVNAAIMISRSADICSRGNTPRL